MSVIGVQMQDDDDNWVRIGLIGTYQGEYRVGGLTVNVNSIHF